MRKLITATVSGLLVYVLMAWLMSSRMGLSGTKLLILRAGLVIIGVIAAAAIVALFANKKKAAGGSGAEAPKAGAAGGSSAGASEDVTMLIREAESKLASARDGKGAKMSSLPAVFLIGDTGSAKTCTIVHSGIDPELLAGQVYQESTLIPTRAANLWFAARALFVEAAGKSVAQPGTWAGIARGLQSSRLSSAFGQAKQAPRAALVAVDAEAFTRPGARESASALARTLRNALGEISETLGVNLPVYVLFTKMDRVPFFAEYVRNLTGEEATQVFGATVPIAVRRGVYAEEETARLGAYFEELFRSLAAARPTFLSRENDQTKTAAVYEFPREFRKLRPIVSQFLVDLCRPSQLTVGPFLRGFYFSGVRPVVITEAAPAPVMRPQERQPREAAHDATGIFRADAGGWQQGAAPAAASGPRKVPQWLFLPHLFHKLILADQSAMGASGNSTKTSALRRILLSVAAVLCLLYSTLLAISYSRNHTLETEARTAARGIEATDPSGAKVATLDSLQRLDALRQSLVQLTEFDRDGSPLSYHWGLYTGDTLYPEVRRLYFDAFRRALFGQTQAGLLGTLQDLPATPGPEFAPTYDTLKAYLITTSNPDKSTKEFLSPVLVNRWSANKNVDNDRQVLARRQFDFYSDELRSRNPYSSANDGASIDKARRYLDQFGSFERVYRAMLAEAERTTKPINFNKQFPGSAATVIDNYDVSGPFTKNGWDVMKNLLAKPERFFNGEPWVLGERGTSAPDRARLAQQLADRYYADFVKAWRGYIKAASIAKYAGIQDAADKLTTLSGNQSPLLALFWLASQNTAVDKPEVKQLFQPIQAMVPPESVDHYIGDSNKPYVTALMTLQSSVDAAAKQPPVTEATAGPVLRDATAARIATKQAAQAFHIDPDARVDAITQKLMEDPITQVEALFRGRGKDELNAKGRGFCAQFRALMSKYPFNSKATTQATLAEVNGIFHKPEGALWAFYDANLVKYLPKQGSQYVGVPGEVTLTPSFVAFFNAVAAFGEMAYPKDSPDPKIPFSLRWMATEGVQGVTLRLEGQSATMSGSKNEAKQFVWPGTGSHGAEVNVKFSGSDFEWVKRDGLWGIYKFFSESEQWQRQGSVDVLDWLMRSGNDTLKQNGKPVTIRFQLDMAGMPRVFEKGYFSQYNCVAEVAK